jgi:hypothetical protein
MFGRLESRRKYNDIAGRARKGIYALGRLRGEEGMKVEQASHLMSLIASRL